MTAFKAEIEIIGVNPFVFVPDKILQTVFKQAGKDKGHIPIKGTINGIQFKQTLVKFSGAWRLYISNIILKNSPGRIGEIIELTIEFDPEKREIQPHPDFIKALDENIETRAAFDSLSRSRQQEIVRYLSFLKTKESLEKNIARAIGFLLEKERFIGTDKP